jgi:hypothetical protein
MNISTDEKEALKKLEKFKKDFNKLMDKYPRVIVSTNVNGSPCAYLSPDAPYSRVQVVFLG